jgi:hypothetical protein
MTRYRITTTTGEGAEQTWVLLPDEASALMQAEEHANRHKGVRVRVYREQTGRERELLMDKGEP